MVDTTQILLGVSDAAKVVGITPDGIRAAAKQGRLAVAMRTASGVRLFRREDVEKFAEATAARRSRNEAVRAS